MPTFFTPGPAQPYPKLQEFMSDAWAEHIPSISHRGKAFVGVYQRTDAAVRELMGVPDDWQIMFLGSATEAMERVVEGLVERRSHHFVNGAFSKKWYEISTQLGRAASVHKAPGGHGFESEFMAAPDAELVCMTLSETSTGVLWPAAEVARLRAAMGDALLAVDVVSAVPVMPVPWEQSDVAFFSVQKAFGLPAGLGVLLLGPRAMERARQRAAKGGRIGSYHSLIELMKGSAKYQTPATPNVLGIYLLGRVAEDMLGRGIDGIRETTASRARRLYRAIEQHPKFKPFVANEMWRSPMVAAVEVTGGSQPVHEHLASAGFVAGDGYGELKDSQFRFANFPASSEEEFEEALAHLIQFDSYQATRV